MTTGCSPNGLVALGMRGRWRSARQRHAGADGTVRRQEYGESLPCLDTQKDVPPNPYLRRPAPVASTQNGDSLGCRLPRLPVSAQLRRKSVELREQFVDVSCERARQIEMRRVTGGQRCEGGVQTRDDLVPPLPELVEHVRIRS